jgi:trans-aconitate methyltransferase
MGLEKESAENQPALLPRETFDEVADLYDEMRPSYPAQVFDDVITVSGVTPGSALLEIGCGTGHATRGFASRGLRIHCIELGANMAAVAREKLAAFPRVSIEVADFDHWTTLAQFDLCYSASAYHWLNPDTREQRIASMLHPRGWLGLWRNRHVRNGSSDDFIDAAQEIYIREAPALVKKRIGLPRPHEVAETEKERLTSGLFHELPSRVYLWQKTYTAAEYVQMLDTHSDHRLLPAERRQRLFDSLTTLIDTHFGGAITKDYSTLLQMARKKV